VKLFEILGPFEYPCHSLWTTLWPQAHAVYMFGTANLNELRRSNVQVRNACRNGNRLRAAKRCMWFCRSSTAFATLTEKQAVCRCLQVKATFRDCALHSENQFFYNTGRSMFTPVLFARLSSV